MPLPGRTRVPPCSERLPGKCICAAGPRPAVRSVFAIFFALLRRIDAGHEDVSIFAEKAEVAVP